MRVKVPRENKQGDGGGSDNERENEVYVQRSPSEELRTLTE